MTYEELIEAFEQDSAKHKPFSNRRTDGPPDLYAMMLLHRLAPVASADKEYGFHDMVAHAEHDQIWFVTDLQRLANVITREQITELVDNGVFYDEDTDSLSMFV